MDIAKYKNIIIVIAVVIGGFMLYSFFVKPQGAAVLTAKTVTASAVSGDQELIGLLSQLRSLSLDDTIFSDPAFDSLQDFSQTLQPEPVGRPNPFAPLGGGASGR